MNVIFFGTFQYRIHIRTTDWWKHLGYYVVPVTILSLFFNIPMFINLQVIIYLLQNVYLSGCYIPNSMHIAYIHCIPNTATQRGRSKRQILTPILLIFFFTAVIK